MSWGYAAEFQESNVKEKAGLLSSRNRSSFRLFRSLELSLPHPCRGGGLFVLFYLFFPPPNTRINKQTSSEVMTQTDW